MPLNPNTVGDAIAAYIPTVAPDDSAPVTPDQLKTMWRGIVKEIFDHINANLKVGPGTFNVINPETSSPVNVAGQSGLPV